MLAETEVKVERNWWLDSKPAVGTMRFRKGLHPSANWSGRYGNFHESRPVRFGPGLSIHTDNLDNWTADDTNYGINGTVHVGFYNQMPVNQIALAPEARFSA